MYKNSIYSQIISSKNGFSIPVLKSGKTIDSKYAPDKEAIRIADSILPDTKFLIVLGLGSALAVQEILNRKPDLFIIIVENSHDDFEFLSQIDSVQKLKVNKNVFFSTADSIYNDILQNYIPCFYGNLQLISLPNWQNEISEKITFLNQNIQKAINAVSADYSVQCHFGKLWTHNILNNCKNLITSKNCSFSIDKTAVVFAAGPSLDSNIQNILQNRNSYYLISTDTAFSTLLNYNIIPEAVISIDGQNISKSHFIHSSTFDLQNTHFFFDLCANSSAVKYLIEKNCNVHFFQSGHPLSEYISKQNTIPQLFSGAGTVTIAAVDLAIKAGFSKIQVFGADFSYINGKPYAKGTYLDKLYNSSNDRINSIENQYDTLQYRTELLKLNDKQFTTTILNSYKDSFEKYLSDCKIEFCKINNIYYLENKNKLKKIEFTNSQNISLKSIFDSFSEKNPENREIKSIFDLINEDISLLPLISWLRNHDNKDSNDFNYFLKKAYSIILNYK